MPRVPRPLIDRITARLAQTSGGCWIYTGALTAAGYGLVGVGGRSDGLIYTHRAMYEYHVASIGEGLHIDHLCRVRACCNPFHLEAVTQGENNRRSWAARKSVA